MIGEYIDEFEKTFLRDRSSPEFLHSQDPKRTFATLVKARLFTSVRPMLVAACTSRKADHVEKRDPRGC